MPNGEKKGITVRIDADLHAEVSQYLRDHSMTMAEFVSLALDDELHPKNQMKEGSTMANTRTIAVQVPEDLFQRIKDYLQRNNMTQRQFLIGLIEDELERDQTERESQDKAVSDDPELDENDPEQNEDAAVDDPNAESDEDEDESEDEDQGFTMRNKDRSDAVWQSDFLICSPVSAASGLAWRLLEGLNACGIFGPPATVSGSTAVCISVFRPQCQKSSLSPSR